MPCSFTWIFHHKEILPQMKNELLSFPAQLHRWRFVTVLEAKDFDAETRRHRVLIYFLCSSVSLRQGFWIFLSETRRFWWSLKVNSRALGLNNIVCVTQPGSIIKKGFVMGTSGNSLFRHPGEGRDPEINEIDSGLRRNDEFSEVSLCRSWTEYIILRTLKTR